MSRGGRDRTPHPLTPEDQRLWELVKSRLEPLHRAKKRVATHALPPHPGSAPTAATPTSAPPPHPRPSHASPAAKPAPALADFDARTARRLAARKLAIERVLDLHGMRQVEAHAALRRFLHTAHGQGIKFVKIITGKGVVESDHAVSHGPAESGRGVLRRMVPHWLAEPELRRIVVSFTSAGRGHGGEGALYVELRRNPRASHLASHR